MLIVEPPRPATRSGIIAADNVGRPQSKGQQLHGVVEIAYRSIVVQFVLGDRPNAPGQAWTSSENRCSPFRETPEGLAMAPKLRYSNRAIIYFA